jgi:dipeptidyl aminopeptidase/acylaminoacyl peptidase
MPSRPIGLSAALALPLLACLRGAPEARPQGQAGPLPPGAVAQVRSAYLRELRGATLLRFSPDGTRLAAVAGGRVVIVADAATGAELVRLGGPQDQVSAVAFSADGQSLIAAGPDQLIRTWDVASGKILRTVQLSPTTGASLALSADGRRLAHTDGDLRVPVRVLDTASGRELARFGKPQPGAQSAEVLQVQIAPDGKVVATSENTARRLLLWDALKGQPLRAVQDRPDDAEGLAFSVNGRMLAAREKDAVSVWETASGQRRRRVQTGPRPITALAFSPDGRYLLAGVEARDTASAEGASLWDLASQRPLARFGSHAGGVRAVAYAPDGKRVATAGADGAVLIWDMAAHPARRPPAGRKLSAKELETLWADLDADDARRAYDAVCALTADDSQSVPFLGERLRTTQEDVAREVSRLIAELGDRRFAVREKATAALRRLGEAAGPALRQAARNPGSDEVRRRLEQLLAPLATSGAALSPEQVRSTRALEVLENAATAEARAALRRLARGEVSTWLAEQAAEALRRLGERAPGK